jgi:hypothetical protein
LFYLFNTSILSLLDCFKKNIGNHAKKHVIFKAHKVWFSQIPLSKVALQGPGITIHNMSRKIRQKPLFMVESLEIWLVLMGLEVSHSPIIFNCVHLQLRKIPLPLLFKNLQQFI